MLKLYSHLPYYSFTKNLFCVFILKSKLSVKRKFSTKKEFISNATKLATCPTKRHKSQIYYFLVLIKNQLAVTGHYIASLH